MVGNMTVPPRLEAAGARWYHTEDYHSPNLSKASLGRFFAAVLSEGAHIGKVWAMSPQYKRSTVLVSVYMTEDMKENIERDTEFKFCDPPKINLNSSR